MSWTASSLDSATSTSVMVPPGRSLRSRAYPPPQGSNLRLNCARGAQIRRRLGVGAARQWSVLQVRELAVEVGGRETLFDASFSLGDGDKAGLVGRNGAGKTSMMKVLAGAAPAARGVVLRPPAVGYLA